MSGIGNITLTASATISGGVFVWREKSRWWESLCTNALYISQDTKPTRFNFVGANLQAYEQACRVYVNPVEVG